MKLFALIETVIDAYLLAAQLIFGLYQRFCQRLGLYLLPILYYSSLHLSNDFESN